MGGVRGVRKLKRGQPKGDFDLEITIMDAGKNGGVRKLKRGQSKGDFDLEITIMKRKGPIWKERSIGNCEDSVCKNQ
ncbi:uncharacterized protein Gasu_61440 [Galdieria sulphuraria]|uniref:Uncharacterized protein n=1 Tax=Galdieria sulphuraria TaxID=130081 RepID=M2X8Q2_GALSU|nr:uncharacterized protein Gasu_61440 [Galdieria sulphuraria]EME26212.1 hypothetical protein Gasu_61440 [Galdieria sulphuraria]|eukprot:XP_005702732.1 hypothetical protein Gasu_61440 [Galdieria sulphuraria]